MTPAQIVRAAIPGADGYLCEHILWGRTPFPFAPVTARSLYKAAASWRRATAKGIVLCDFCHRLAEPDQRTCKGCAMALAAGRDQ
jgi:hypothetical protein